MVININVGFCDKKNIVFYLFMSSENFYSSDMSDEPIFSSHLIQCLMNILLQILNHIHVIDMFICC